MIDRPNLKKIQSTLSSVLAASMSYGARKKMARAIQSQMMFLAIYFIIIIITIISVIIMARWHMYDKKGAISSGR